jgi:hypothetical protein
VKYTALGEMKARTPVVFSAAMIEGPSEITMNSTPVSVTPAVPLRRKNSCHCSS